MPSWVYTGKVYKLSEFGILDFALSCSPVGRVSSAFIGEDGPWIDVVPHPDDESEELWAEVQRKEVGDGL